MAFLKINATKENVEDFQGNGGNSRYINKSGMYDVILKSVITDTSASGSDFINLWLEHEGQEQPIYQAIRITNKDGSPNLGQKMFMRLAIIAGGSDGQDINDPVSRMVPMGKGGAEKECMVLEDFDNLPVTIRVQMEYSMWEGKIRESKTIKNFFRFEDKATAAEIVESSDEKGKQFAVEFNYADKANYKDGLTEEDIVEWKKSFSSGKKEETPVKTFAPKRTFGKK